MIRFFQLSGIGKERTAPNKFNITFFCYIKFSPSVKTETNTMLPRADAVSIPLDFWPNPVDFGQYGTYFGQNRKIFHKKFGNSKNIAYLCDVFFIVLDLRLRGAAVPRFFCLTSSVPLDRTLAIGWPHGQPIFICGKSEKARDRGGV